MNRQEFMKELEHLLSDITAEERSEALLYYEDYFEDAGIENEAAVIAELGSPAKVAKSIQLDMSLNNERGEFTERGYQSGDQTNPYAVMKTQAEEGKDETLENGEFVKIKVSDQASKTQDTNNEHRTSEYRNNEYSNNENRNKEQFTNQTHSNNSDSNTSNGNYQNGQYYNGGNQSRNSYGNPYDRTNEPVRKKGMSPLLIVLLCIFALPVGLPLLCAVFGVFVGIAASLFGIVFSFGAAAFACILSGFVMFVIGISKVFVLPFFGMIFMAGGLIVFGIGLLFAVLTSFCAKFIPVLCRAFVSICKAPFRRGSVIA